MLCYRGAEDAGQDEPEDHADKRMSQPIRSIRCHFTLILMLFLVEPITSVATFDPLGSNLSLQYIPYQTGTLSPSRAIQKTLTDKRSGAELSRSPMVPLRGLE